MRCLKFNASALNKGFTLIEVMVVLATLGILAAIALPSYEHHVHRSKARAAASDLVTLSLVLESTFLKQLAYPSYADHTNIAAQPAERPEPVASDFAAWVPSQAKDFKYSISSSAQGYQITASSDWCTLTLNERNERPLHACPALSHW